MPSPASLCLPAAFHGENHLATFPRHAAVPTGVSPLQISVRGSARASLQGATDIGDTTQLLIALASQRPIVTPTLPVQGSNESSGQSHRA